MNNKSAILNFDDRSILIIYCTNSNKTLRKYRP